MAATIIGAAIAAGVSIYGAAKGAKEKKKAQALADANKRPLYNTPSTEYDNQRLAEMLASQGISDPAKNAAMRGYDRGLTSSINAILQGGGNPNDVSNAYDVYNTHAGQLALADDERRRANIAALISQNKSMSDYADKNYQVNQYAPYANTAAKAAAMYQQGDQQLMSGINGVAGAVGTAAGAIGRMYDLSKVNGRGTGDAGTSPSVSPSAYNNPLSTTYINGNGFSAGQSIYDPTVGQISRNFNWSKIKPENQQTYWNLLNNRFTSGNLEQQP